MQPVTLMGVFDRYGTIVPGDPDEEDAPDCYICRIVPLAVA